MLSGEAVKPSAVDREGRLERQALVCPIADTGENTVEREEFLPGRPATRLGQPGHDEILQLGDTLVLPDLVSQADRARRGAPSGLCHALPPRRELPPSWCATSWTARQRKQGRVNGAAHRSRQERTGHHRVRVLTATSRPGWPHSLSRRHRPGPASPTAHPASAAASSSPPTSGSGPWLSRAGPVVEHPDGQLPSRARAG